MSKLSTRILWRLLTLLFFAGNVLLLLLIILSGTTQSYPIDRFYWVQANTTGIPNASDVTRWTFWGACGNDDGHTVCSGNLAAAYPISVVDNFHTRENVPSKFISNRDSFYYLSRFAFAFFWIALSFIGVSFILYILTWFSEVILQVVFILMAFGCFFNICAVVFQTAVTVLARNAFHDGDRSAKIGASLMGIAWASVVVSLWEFCSLAFWFSSKRIRDYFNNDSLTEKHHNNFFHRNTEPLAVPEPIMNQDTYSPQPTSFIDPNINTNGAIAIDTTLPDPVQTTVAPEGNTHKGINFFKIRRSQKPNPDDVSV